MYLVAELAAEQSRSTMERAERLRLSRRLLMLRRARRLERREPWGIWGGELLISGAR